ncbi:uncharacterized protein MELLADRAFT_60768 [Melampsora larici-populina 98AG31]|uniref:Uncharacterized protein n=1 Tax=Melampsora larici-populina (strain 98AG31 / pathotype 3-4-7) TaxID=747676 RepID=F4RC69_MELLP|nr:uncharacterized protein MELLADRAFT_60768 [Melampsora larici-populina 98AG31]EGG09685.1 hypothetical protein MELLADRAFT_60768 [Melampsora larici-populina 98AG31]
MPSNPYKTSASHLKSAKRWVRAVRKNAELGTVSKTEMIVVHSLVRRHLRVLMCRESHLSPIPMSLSAEEESAFTNRFPDGDPLPHANSVSLISVTDFVHTGPHMKKGDFWEVEMDLKRFGLRRFSFNWEAGFDNRANKLAGELFWTSFYRAIKSRSYKYIITPHVLTREIVYPVFIIEFNHLRSKYKTQCSSLEVLQFHSMVNAKEMVCKEYSECLIKEGVNEVFISIFQPRNFMIMGNESEVMIKAGNAVIKEIHVEIPRRWSEKTIRFMEVIEQRVQFHSKSRYIFPGSIRPIRKYVKSNSFDYGFVPRHLPADLYSDDYHENLLPNEFWELKVKPAALPSIEEMESIFPVAEAQLVHHLSDKAVNEYYSSDDNISEDEHVESEDEDMSGNTEDNISELKRVKGVFQNELSNLKDDLLVCKTTFTSFKDGISDMMPVCLAELNKAKDDIATLHEKLNEIQGKLNSSEGVSSSGGNKD